MTTQSTTTARTDADFSDYALTIHAPENMVDRADYVDNDPVYPRDEVEVANERTAERLREQYPGLDVETSMKPRQGMGGGAVYVGEEDIEAEGFEVVRDRELICEQISETYENVWAAEIEKARQS